jgi:hypothetical protein
MPFLKAPRPRIAAPDVFQTPAAPLPRSALDARVGDLMDDAYVEDASQAALEAIQRQAVDAGRVPPVFRLFRDEDGRVMAWDANKYTHDEAREILGLGDTFLQHGQFRWGSALDRTDWYDRTGKPRTKAPAPAKLPPEIRRQRAEALGFDTGRVLYHGTDAEFDAFKPGEYGELGPGIYLGDEDVAREFGARVLPVYVRGPLFPLTEDMARGLENYGNTAKARAVIEVLQAEGYAGIENPWTGNISVFDPKNIRHIDAAFDPAHAGSSKIMAGIAIPVAGVGASLLFPESAEAQETTDELIAMRRGEAYQQKIDHEARMERYAALNARLDAMILGPRPVIPVMGEDLGGGTAERRVIPDVDDPVRDAPAVRPSPAWSPALARPAAPESGAPSGVGMGGMGGFAGAGGPFVKAPKPKRITDVPPVQPEAGAGTAGEPFGRPAGFRSGRTRVGETAQREFEPRDLVLARNDGMSPLDIGLEFGVDPEKAASVSRHINVLATRTRETIREAQAQGRLGELAAQWSVSEDELARFISVSKGAKAGPAEAKLRRAIEIAEALNKSGTQPDIAMIADRMRAGGIEITNGSLQVYLSRARTGNTQHVRFPEDLMARAKELKIAKGRAAPSYTRKLGAGFVAMGVTASLFGEDAEAQEGAAAEPERPEGRGRWIAPAQASGGLRSYATPERQAAERAAREEQERLTQTPDFWSGTVPAAFRTENVVASWLANERVTDYDGRRAIARGEAEAFNPFGEAGFLDGFEDDADRFYDTLTRREADSLRRQILRERDDRRILSLSGAPGFLAAMSAGTIDPTVIIPSGAAWKAGDSLLMFMGKAAWMGGVQATTSEYLLHQTQELRTLEESAIATGAGVLLMGVIGGPIAHQLIRETDGAIVTRVVSDLEMRGDADPQFAFGRADQAAMEGAHGRPGSVGAAAVEGPDIAGEAVAESFGLAELSALGSRDGGAGLVQGINPILRLAQSPSPAAREASNKLMESGLYLKRNLQGEASPVAVETAMRLHRGREAKAVTNGRTAYKAYRKAGGGWSRTEFLEEVGRSMRRGDEHPDASVKVAVTGYREMFDAMKDEAIRMNLLPEDIDVDTAASYLHRMWNRKALTGRPEVFQNMAKEYLLGKFEGMKRRAVELEVDLERMKLETTASRDAMREAQKAATVERRAVKEREAMLRAAQQRLAKAEADGHTGAAARAKKRISDLEEELAHHRPLAEARQKDYDAAQRQHAGVRAAAKLSDEDMALVMQARQLADLEAVEGTLDGVAATAARDIYRQLTGYDFRTMPPRLTIMDRGPLAERTFHIPDLFQSRRPGLEAKVEDFLVDDIEALSQRYMRVMSADIEMTRAFGDPGMMKALEDVNASFDELVDQVEDTVREAFEAAAEKSGKAVDEAKLQAAVEKQKSAIETRRARDVRDLAGVRDILRGNYGNPADPESLWVRGGAFVRAWNYVTLLGGMTVTAFSDVAGKVLSNGYLGLTRDLIGPLLTDLKGAKVAAREAREYGIAVERALAARIATMTDIGDAYGRGTAFDRWLANLTNRFSSWTGMRLWNDVMRTADYIIAQNRAIRILEGSGAGKQVAKRDLRWLAWAGVDVDSGMAAAIRRELATHGDTDGGMRLANTHLWDDVDAARAFKAVMSKESATATVEVGAGDKLLAMHGDLGKTIGQFRSFTFAAHQRITLRAMQQLRQGDAAVGSWFVTATSLGMMVYALKMWDSLRETSDDPATWVREGVDRSGMFPILFEGYNSAEKIIKPGKDHPLKWAFPGDASSRFQSRGPLGSLIGPSFGRVDDLMALAGNLSDGQVKDVDLHAARKLIPYNNLFGLRQIFDRLEIEAVAATGVEETAFSDRRQKALAN